jgi:hypothetical protein
MLPITQREGGIVHAVTDNPFSSVPVCAPNFRDFQLVDVSRMFRLEPVEDHCACFRLGVGPA